MWGTLNVTFCASLLLCAGLAAAQAKPGAASPSIRVRKTPVVAFRSECLESVGLCVSVPGAWQRLGGVFDGLGFVAAEPHPGADSATWPQLTVAAIQPAAQNGSGTASPASAPAAESSAAISGTSISLDALVDVMLTPEGALASAHILERSRLLLNGANAQIVRVEFRDAAGNPNAVEEVALIEGDDGLVYSIALRCAPQDFDRLEPVFQQAAQSWHLQTADASPAPTPSPVSHAAPLPSSAPAHPPEQAQPGQDSDRP